MPGTVLRETRGFCPTCMKDLPVQIIEEDDKVYQVKDCPEHGEAKGLLSRDATYYKELSDYYFPILFPPDREGPKRILNYYNYYMTLRCNLNCPICLTDANAPKREPTLDEIEKTIKGFKNFKIGMWGGEPTMRDDLMNVIRIIRRTGNIPALYTNGIKLKDPHYLDGLLKAGLEVVHMQFDGYDDEGALVLRGAPMADNRRKAMDVLEDAGVPTVLETTHVRDVNLDQVGDIFEEAVKRPNVRAVLFKSYSYLGKAGVDVDLKVAPEDLMDVLIERFDGRFSRQDILNFQRSLIAFYDILRMHRCLFNHYYLVLRETDAKDGYHTVGELIDLAAIQPALEAYKDRRVKGSSLATPFLVLSMLPHLLRPRAWPLLRDAISTTFHRLVYGERFTGATMSTRSLILAFGSVCDPYTYDAQASKYCIGGEITVDDGTFPTLWASNFHRERDLRAE